MATSSQDDLSFVDAADYFDSADGSAAQSAAVQRVRTQSGGESGSRTASRAESTSSLASAGSGGSGLQRLVRTRSKKDVPAYKAMRKNYDAEKVKKRGEALYPDMGNPPLHAGFIYVSSPACAPTRWEG